MRLIVAVCDDDRVQLELVKEYINCYSVATDHDLNVRVFESGEELCVAFRNGFHADVIFLDIEMPRKTGLETAEYIRSLKKKMAVIIFLSNYPEYMLDSFALHPHRYILKPLNYQEFSALMNSLIADMRENDQNLIMLKTKDGESVFEVDKIYYIHADKLADINYPLKITDDMESIRCKGSIEKLCGMLGNLGFVIPARGWLINMKYIRKFTEKGIVLKCGTLVPVSRRRQAEIKKKFVEFISR